jgi:hypothetical protein
VSERKELRKMKRTVIVLLVLCVPLYVTLLAACDGKSGGGTRILFVDDDNGLNNLGDGVGDNPDVDHVYTGDLDALGKKYAFFRVTGPGADGPDLDTLNQYKVVIWATGENYSGSSAEPDTLTLQDQTNLAAFLESGGRLLLSSQDILYDLMDGDEVGDVISAFANSYLGVLDAVDGGAVLTTTYGVAGDPVSDGYALTGNNANSDEFVDGFDTSSILGSETGIFQYDSVNATALTLIAEASSGFASTVFNGRYGVDELTDDTLSFNNQSFWTQTDGDASVIAIWYEPLGINHFAVLNLTGEPYFYNEIEGVTLTDYTDALNETHALPAHANTLFVDPDGEVTAVRVEQDPWKVLFLAFAYEGLGPENDRRAFLEAAIDWLRE